ASGLYPAGLGSRILGGRALAGGMPLWKYVGNRVLTLVQNILLGAKLSEYHTGYRAFAREVLTRLPLDANSDDFVFDSQLLAQMRWFGYLIAEVTCPTRYSPEASSIGLGGSIRYGIGCVRTAIIYRLAKMIALNDPSRMGPASRAVIADLQSDAFVRALDRLVGIEGLLADPELDGGGLQQTLPGGFLNVHTDFLAHSKRRTWSRQVNLL